MVAGYCWDWKSKSNSSLNDVVIPEYDFGMQWNLLTDGSLWIISPESVNQIGCIHTCQGLEVDYIGVIIGDDLIIRDGQVITNPHKRSKNDSSVRGFKKLLVDSPSEGSKTLDLIIKNTYRTLIAQIRKLRHTLTNYYVTIMVSFKEHSKFELRFIHLQYGEQ
jgi:DUF2075 family protein